MQETAEDVNNESHAQVHIRYNRGVKLYQLSMQERLEFLLIYKKSIQLFVEVLQTNVLEVSLERLQKDLVMTISAETGIVNIREHTYSNVINEIQQRADAINCLLEISQRAGITVITAVIKK